MTDSAVSDVTINWSRCIHIDDVIDDRFINSLIPKILELRHQSSDPITVAINSPGGSLASLDVLLGLLTGPDQDGQVGEIVTVSVRHAQSAAANLLAFGTYAVALGHSEILFHDVRYTGMEDVTPSTARIAAARLQNANEQFSLRLAKRIFRRLVWNYLDLQMQFKEIAESFPVTHKNFHVMLAHCKGSAGEAAPGRVDVASFATALFAKVSRESEPLIKNTVRRLSQWGVMTHGTNAIPRYKQKGSRKSGLLDGLKTLFDSIIKAGKNAHGDDIWAKAETDLHLWEILLTTHISKSESPKNFKFTDIIEKTLDDFRLIESINAPAHNSVITRNMLRHASMFFTEESRALLSSGVEADKKNALDEARPAAELFWYFCLLLCRELFDGEHAISPSDAQVLGIVDEVAGGGPILSRRDFEKQLAEEKQPT